MSEEIKKLPALLSETPSKIVQSRDHVSTTICFHRRAIATVDLAQKIIEIGNDDVINFAIDLLQALTHEKKK